MLQCASDTVYLDMDLRQLKQFLTDVASMFSRCFYNNVEKCLRCQSKKLFLKQHTQPTPPRHHMYSMSFSSGSLHICSMFLKYPKLYFYFFGNHLMEFSVCLGQLFVVNPFECTNTKGGLSFSILKNDMLCILFRALETLISAEIHRCLFPPALRHIKRKGKELVLSAMQQQSKLLKIMEIFMNHNSITNTPSNSPRLILLCRVMNKAEWVTSSHTQTHPTYHK